MCSNCRRTQRADRSGWDWVPEWVRGAPVRVSHGICEICSGFLYGRVAPTRVIVVDGVAPVRRLIARILNAAFYDVVECADAATAREQLAAASFDVLITDALLPDGLGLDLARAARARSPALQCVIATGDGTMATEAGIRWLHKPLEPGALKKLLPPP